MSALINIPFNFQPSGSTSVKTTAYTVPAGKYAKAIIYYYLIRTVNATAGVPVTATQGSVTVDGVPVLYEPNVAGSISIFTASNTTITFSPIAQVSVVGSASGTSSVGVGGAGIASIITSGTVVGSGIGSGALTVTSGGAGSVGAASYIATWSKVTSVEIWLSSGQVLTGTQNWRAIVTEYNNIS